MRYVLACVVMLLTFVGLVFLGTALHLFHFEIFAPKYENVRRHVFEETKSYTYGMVQDLVKYKYEWERTDAIGKRAIENMIRIRFANFSPKKINNTELRKWFEQIMMSKSY